MALRKPEMKNRTDFETEHRRAWEAIPWIVNGSATDGQRQWVDEHVQACDDCRAEFARQSELQAAIAQESAPVTDAEGGLQRLFQRIDHAADEAALAPAGVARPRERRSGFSGLVYGLTFAVVVEAVGISVLGVGLLSHTESAPGYRTLSDVPATGARATIRIVPAAGMSLGDLQQLLQGLQLEVVAGPSESGAYALAPVMARASVDNKGLDAQIARLRAAPGMRLVEPIRAPETTR
jgi:anti-sigma factor RsiW